MAAAVEAAGPVVFTEGAIFAAVEHQTGLSIEHDAIGGFGGSAGDSGDDRFLTPLGLLLHDLEAHAPLSAFGRVNVFGTIVTWLSKRAQLGALLRQHPEIHDVELAPPIVICGQPRTGTTHLHNLISADPAMRSLPYWESNEPVLSAADAAVVAAGHPDPRRARTAEGLWFLNTAMPLFQRMHEMTTDHVHEEIDLLGSDLSTQLVETIADLPSYQAWYKASDQRPSYRYLTTVLKALQWQRPAGRRWILKSPQHIEWFPAMVDVFPGASFVVTHRDPVAVTASVCTMLAYTARLRLDPCDPVAISRYWSQRMEEMNRACVRDREVLPTERSIDVLFHEFMADDLAMVERIYAVAGQPMTDDARSAMRRFVAEHPRGRHGAIEYDLAQLGLDPDELRNRNAFYEKRFPVAREW